MKWLYFTHPDTKGKTEVPDEPGVQEWHEARGWVLGEKPDEPVFVPKPGTDDPEKNTEWVTLFHPAVSASHDFPNNPEAIAGAMESGWIFPPDAPPAPPEEEPSEPKKTTKKATASADAKTEKENG